MEADVQWAIAETIEVFGPPLIVIGQTKYNVPGDFADITNLELYVESFRSYTMSSLYLLHAVLPAMQDAGWGGSCTSARPRPRSPRVPSTM